MSIQSMSYEGLTKPEARKFSGWPNVKADSEARAASPAPAETPRRGRPPKVEAETQTESPE